MCLQTSGKSNRSIFGKGEKQGELGAAASLILFSVHHEFGKLIKLVTLKNKNIKKVLTFETEIRKKEFLELVGLNKKAFHW